MAYYLSKYHLGINSKGYILSQKNGVRYYQKKRAPNFVNRVGSGDPAYRDSSFWSYFVQSNWRNGAKQLKFDDAGKFWKSSDVDTTQLEELTLSKALTSTGQTAASVGVNIIDSWRAASAAAFGDGSDGALSISSDTTEAPIDSACTGTIGTSALTATNVSFAANQIILIHQSQGTGVGQWEKNTIAGYTAGTITTGTPLVYTYATGAQVRVLKQYSGVTIDSTKTYTAKAWNGTVGGIIGWYCNGTTTVTGTLTASGKGFRGGTATADSQPATHTGEGTVGTEVSGQSTKNGNGGGGAWSDFGGGSGGGNGTAGTNGQGTGGDAVGTANLVTADFGGGGGGASGSSNWRNGGNGGGWIFFVSKTVTVTGAITNAGLDGGGGTADGAGGGAGGSTLVKGQTVTLGTTLVTAAAGAGGSGSTQVGKAGGVGRIHVDYSTSVSGTTTPTLDSTQDSTLVDTPASTSSVGYSGTTNGKIFTWDNGTTWTEVFDTRELTWYETGTDADKVVGDTGGTETAQSQGFQIATAQTIKGVDVYIKKAAGTPGDITVRIETNNAGVPSGTLANANATATIPAFTTSTYSWKRVEFTTGFSLSATTLYHLVLKTAAAGNDNNYNWAANSAGTYSSGAMSASTDGGSTWGAVAAADAYFRILGNATSVNCSLVTKVGGTKKIYFGTGDPAGSVVGDARLYSYNGSAWALTKTFTADTAILSMTEFAGDTNVYLGVATGAVIYKTTDFSTFTSSKDIDVPDNPGYPYVMSEYNNALYVGGGSPELVPTQFYDGFVYYNDTTQWRSLYPYEDTVIKAMEFYDSFLFFGTYFGYLIVFDSSSLNPLFNLKDQYNYAVQVLDMKRFEDKLFVATYPQSGSGETNVGVWVFDRRGFHLAHTVAGVAGFKCFGVVNGTLLVGTGDNGYVYKLDTTYATTGWYQSSYFDANLPSISKLYNSIVIRHDPLVSGQSINVYYKFKETDSWTQLTTGASNAVGDIEQTLTFASGVTSKKISLKVVLNGGGTNTPRLTEVVLQYALYPALKWQWNLRLKAKSNLVLADNTTESRSAATIRSDLESLMNTQTLYTFVDVDGTSHNVLVNDIDQTSWVINPADVSEDEIALSLLEA